MPQTFYYTVPRKLIRSNMPEMPVMISALSCFHPKPTKMYPRRLRVPNLPTHITERAADCGGFRVTHWYDGRYPFTLEEYLTWLTDYRPQWAAMPDLLCVNLDKSSPGETIIRERQETMRECYEYIWSRYAHKPWAWCPTLQGYSVSDYRRHAEMLAPLLHEMQLFYWEAPSLEIEEDEDFLATETRDFAFRIGIGGLVGRDHPDFLRAIVLAVQEVLGESFAIHAWGVKKGFLKRGKIIKGLRSYDSGAFNGRFGSDIEEKEDDEQTGQGGQPKESQADRLWSTKQPEYAEAIAPYLVLPQYQTLWEPKPDIPQDIYLTMTHRFSDPSNCLSAKERQAQWKTVS